MLQELLHRSSCPEGAPTSQQEFYKPPPWYGTRKSYWTTVLGGPKLLGTAAGSPDGTQTGRECAHLNGKCGGLQNGKGGGNSQQADKVLGNELC